MNIVDHLLMSMRASWETQDWEGLIAQGTAQDLSQHPGRVSLALLTAVAFFNTHDVRRGREYLELASIWGATTAAIKSIQAAGFHYSLGRAYLLIEEPTKAEYSLNLGAALVGEILNGVGWHTTQEPANAVLVAANLGLLKLSSSLLEKKLASLKLAQKQVPSELKILSTEVKLLSHELSIAQQRRQLAAKPQQNGSKADDELTALKDRATSQLGQDIWALEKCGLKREGYFVEFGATDGVLLSNTWLLEKEFGWMGICAEPSPEFFAKLTANRSCLCSNQYIGRETGQEVEFILAGVYGGSSEFAADDKHKDKRDAYAQVGHTMKLTSISLHDFLTQHHAPIDIDYMSVDTEGSEYDLLSVFPFDQWNIRLITVEHNFTEQRGKIRTLLEKHGYRCTERQWDDWYEKQ